MLPMMIFEQADPTQLRTYQEKRDLVGHVGYCIKRFDDPLISGRDRRIYEAHGGYLPPVPICRPFRISVSIMRPAMSGCSRSISTATCGPKSCSRVRPLRPASPHESLIETIVAEDA